MPASKYAGHNPYAFPKQYQFWRDLAGLDRSSAPIRGEAECYSPLLPLGSGQSCFGTSSRRKTAPRNTSVGWSPSGIPKAFGRQLPCPHSFPLSRNGDAISECTSWTNAHLQSFRWRELLSWVRNCPFPCGIRPPENTTLK